MAIDYLLESLSRAHFSLYIGHFTENSLSLKFDLTYTEFRGGWMVPQNMAHLLMVKRLADRSTAHLLIVKRLTSQFRGMCVECYFRECAPDPFLVKVIFSEMGMLHYYLYTAFSSVEIYTYK